MSKTISVEMPIENDWPSAEELAARNAIIDELDAKGIGQFVGAGGGMGAMDFSYKVGDEVATNSLIQAAIEKHLPGCKYSVSVF